MCRYVLQASLMILTVMPTAASAIEGMSQDSAELRRTIIGTLLARSAGTGTYRAGASNHNSSIKIYRREILQRLLELVHFGRSESPDKIVNEAVAARSGYVCPNYERLPLRMEGCTEENIPIYIWKDAFEVQNAAQRLGFSCTKPVKGTINCIYKANFSQHSIQFWIMPSIDGQRSGPDSTYEVEAKMRYDTGDGLDLDIVEKKL